MELWEIALQEKGLYHYGTKHHSGRYPYGSGDRPYQDRETARAEKYRSAEIKKLIKRHNKQTSKLLAKDYALYKRHGEINDDPKSFTGKSHGHEVYTDSKAREVHRIMDKRDTIEGKLAAYNHFYEKEMKALKTMSISDINAEKQALGRSYLKRAVAGSLLAGPIASVALGSTAYSAKNKTKLRTGETANIHKKAKQFKLDSEGYSYTTSGLTPKESREAGKYLREQNRQFKQRYDSERASKDAEFKRRRAVADKAGDTDYPDKFILEDIQRDRQEKERERKLSQLRKDADEWNKSGRDPEVGRKSAEKYKAAKKKKK